MTVDNSSEAGGAGIIAALSDPGELKAKWLAFFKMWFEPFNAALFVLMSAMYLMSAVGSNVAAGVIAQTVMALTAGLLGARIANAWSSINSEAILKARGTVAVRGLQLMLRNVRALERRVLRFGEIEHEPAAALSAGRRNYEEIIEMCRVLSEEGVSSIETWIDIVPQARQATLVGEMTALQNSIEEIQREKADVETKLAGLAGQQDQREASYRQQLASKESQIAELTADMEGVRGQFRKIQNIARPGRLDTGDFLKFGYVRLGDAAMINSPPIPPLNLSAAAPPIAMPQPARE